MGNAASRIPAHILAAGRRGARPGEIEELRRHAASDQSTKSENRLVDNSRREAVVPKDAPIDLERCCRDLDARRREYRRRVDAAVEDAYDSRIDYRVRGIPEDVREDLIASVRRGFLAELEQFLRANAHIKPYESAPTEPDSHAAAGGRDLVGPALWCVDSHARRCEAIRRVEDALQYEYDTNYDYRVRGIPEHVRSSIREDVERSFLDELRAFQASRNSR